MADWITNAVNEFAQAAGLNDFNFQDASILQLDFEQSGTLYIERLDTELLMMLVRPINPYQRLFAMRSALSACDNKYAPLFIQTGLRGSEELVFIARVDANMVSRQMLEQMLDRLMALQDTANT